MKLLKRIQILLIIVVIAGSCRDSFNFEYFGTISGQVTDLDGAPLPNVKVAVDTVETFTDNDGNFFLEEVLAGDTVLVNFSMQSYAPTQKKTFVKMKKNSMVQAALSRVGLSTSLDNSIDNTISFQGAEVSLTANSLVDDQGNIFTGTAQVTATYFDPTKEKYTDVFPGDFTGENLSGDMVAIESFGFIAVEFTDGNTDLDLAPGAQAEISLPIPQSIMARAPDPIPLWYYDDEKGRWVEEGSATIQNGKYVGQVGHFSFWNVDMAFETCRITGRVLMQDRITVVDSVTVVATGVDYYGSDRTITDSGGRFTLYVKSDSKAAIQGFTFTPPPIRMIECRTNQVIIDPTCPPGGSNDIGDLLLTCTQDTMTNRYYDAFSANCGTFNIAVGVGGRVVRDDFLTSSWITIPVGTDATLHGIYMTDYDYKKAWIVGTNGTVKYSEDYCHNWTTFPLGTVQDLYDVEFSGPGSGLIVGSVGSIFSTIDGGLSWSTRNSGTVQDLRDAEFATPWEAWAVGTLGTIIHTNNGGASWSPQQSGSVENLSGVAFTDENIGWVVGDNGVLLHTSNGGQSWQNVNSGTLEDLHGIDFAHAGFGKIAGKNGIILTTEDGGQTWAIDFETPRNNLSSVRFGGMAAGIIAGDDNLLIIPTSQKFPPNTNGWVQQQDGVTTPLNDLAITSTTEVWVVGDQGVLLHTTNSGSNWSQVSTGFSDDFLSICRNGSSLWIAGENEAIILSHDDGNSWQKVHSTLGGKPARKIQFIDTSIGWALFSDSTGGSMVKSTDGGMSWSSLSGFPSTQASYFSDFEFVNEMQGWLLAKDISSDDDFLYKTIDGGSSWQRVDSETRTSSEYTDLEFLDGNIGWISSIGDWAYVTQDGGRSWFGQMTYLYRSPMKVDFIDHVNGWGITNDRHWNNQTMATEVSVTRTRDGGKTWYYQKAKSGDFPLTLKNIRMVNDKIGWAVGGTNGFIFYTNTGGD